MAPARHVLHAHDSRWCRLRYVPGQATQGIMCACVTALRAHLSTHTTLSVLLPAAQLLGQTPRTYQYAAPLLHTGVSTHAANTPFAAT